MTQVYFIRHIRPNFDLKTLHLLVAKPYKVGVIFKPIPSTNPEDYKDFGKKAVNAIKWLHDILKEDCLICATYGEALQGMVIGKPRADGCPHVLAGTDNGEKGLMPVKIIELDDDAKCFRYEDFPVLATLVPRQGTIRHAYNLRDAAIELYHFSKLPRKVTALSPGQLESLCAEYLRSKKLLDFLHLPVGRTLRDVDIVGSVEEQRVYAQVTFANKDDEVQRKMEKLRGFSGTTAKKYFFAPRSVGPHESDVTFFAIEDVFKEFDENPALDLILGQAD